MTGLGDRTPYNNGVIHDLRPCRSAFHLSSNYKLNASTIPTLFVTTDPKVSPQSLLSRGSSPLRPQFSIPNHSPQMAEAIKNPVALHPVSLVPAYRVASSSSTPRRAAWLPQPKTPRSLRLRNALKGLPEQSPSFSPTEQCLHQIHARADYHASSSARLSRAILLPLAVHQCHRSGEAL